MPNFTKIEIEKARHGLVELEESILSVLHNNPEGLRNSEIAKGLGIESHFNGKQRNYLTYSIIGLLMAKGLIRKKEKDLPIYILK